MILSCPVQLSTTPLLHVLTHTLLLFQIPYDLPECFNVLGASRITGEFTSEAKVRASVAVAIDTKNKSTYFRK